MRPAKFNTLAIATLTALLIIGCSAHNALRRCSDENCIDHTVRLKASIYYLSLESDYTQTNKSGSFRDLNGSTLYRGSDEFKSMASIEGSAKLDDGRVLTYSGKVRGEVRWNVVKHPYGMGALCPLVPMRSAAVDPDVIPLGARLFIHQTKGLALPDGSRHDGIWYAVDTGTSIRGGRIDLFSGAGKTSMKQLSYLNMQSLEVKVTSTGQDCNKQ